MRRLGIYFYSFSLILIGMGFIVISLNFINSKLAIDNWLNYIYGNAHTRALLGLIGLLLIIVSVSLTQLILGTLDREKTIAFDTPTGAISISLSAIEDLIKRSTSKIFEVKEVRPNVIARRGIEVNLRVILRSEANIAEITSRIQDLVKSKIQEMLVGIDEPIRIRIHVAKIVTEEESKKDAKKKDSGISNESNVPYHGYARPV